MIMRVLVTGGAGFIGSHLVEKLIESGYEVVVIDNLFRGKIENLESVIDKIVFVKENIIDAEKIKPYIKNSEFVFHLAALSRVIPSIENPRLCLEYNVKGTEIVARLCSKYNTKLVFSSSREVYGNANYLPVDEQHPLNPENPYGASKVAAEKIIEAYGKCYGLNYVILRLANVYGKRDFDRVIPIFIEKALKGEDLIVYAGKQMLDFIYIDDVIEAFEKCMSLNKNCVMNIGSGKGTKILDLAKLIVEMLNKNCKIKIEKGRKGEVEKFVANIEKAEKVLKWKPKTELKEGIRKMIK